MAERDLERFLRKEKSKNIGLETSDSGQASTDHVELSFLLH